MKKGLRPNELARLQLREALKYCPDEEGIKTVLVALVFFHGWPLKYCPDEEGIKTLCQTGKERGEQTLKYCPDEEGIKTDERDTGNECDDFEVLP